MLKKFNKFVWVSLLICIMFIVAGVLLAFFPEVSLTVISYIIAGTLILSGTLLILDHQGTLLQMSFLPTGILAVLLGLVIFLYPNSVSIIIPIVVGIWIIINSIVNVQLSYGLKKSGYSYWYLSLLLSASLIVCGIIIIFNPQITSMAFTTLLGLLMIGYSLSCLVNILMFKNKMNELIEIFK